MYSIVKSTSEDDFSGFDYIFKKIEEFEQVVPYLYLPLSGVYRVALVTTNIDNVLDIIQNEQKYSNLALTIFMEEQAMDKVASYVPEANFEQSINTYQMFVDLVAERHLLFERHLLYKVYRSIDHNLIEMMNVLDEIVMKFGSEIEITEKQVSTIIAINDIVYPRQVIMKFIEMDIYRWRLYNKCIKQLGNDIMIGSFVKSLKDFVKAKTRYLKTGQGNKYIREMNTSNLAIAYRIFVTERVSINDSYILLKLYENGVSEKDLLGGKGIVSIR